VDPWHDGGPPGRVPRRPGLGCLVAAIVGALGLVVAAVLAAQLLGAALSGVQLR